jgi:hypothetical protein
MGSCEDVQFKQHAITELSVEQIPPIDIYCHMQAMYFDK